MKFCKRSQYEKEANINKNVRNIFKYEIKNNVINNQILEDVRTCYEINDEYYYEHIMGNGYGHKNA